MDYLYPPETRGRSRSKTPFLRSSCDRELCAHAGEGHVHERKKSPLKRSPLVRTIVEEYVEESTPNRQVEAIKQKSSKMTTSDYSSEDTSPETARTKSSVHSSVTVTKTQTITTSNISNSFGNKSTANNQSSFIMQQSRGGAVRSKEISQNEINSAFEENQNIQTSTPILYSTKMSHVSGVTNGDLSNHIAYKEYKEAGEYWKKFPKTDYTYSKLSPHRRELAPGIVAMPNMSRPSLDKHQERITYMIQQNPAQESYIRKRYEASLYQTNKQFSHQTHENFSQMQGLAYDSQDEVDLTELDTYITSRRYMQSSAAHPVLQNSLTTRTITRIVTIFYSFLDLFWSSNDKLYYTRLEQKQGVFGRVKSAISTAILSLFRYIYLLISSVLYLDTWLLKSSAPDNRVKKRFLLFLLLLLPLLLLTAWNLLDEKERQAILLRCQNVIPISLLGFRNIFPTNWRNLLNLNIGFLGYPDAKLSSSQYVYSNPSITNNFQKSLSPDEYEGIINHINVYVQKLVDDKLSVERQKASESETKITKEMSLLIANTVRENLINAGAARNQLELNEDEIERIAAVIRMKMVLENSNPNKFSLSQENLEEISKLIKQNIEINTRNYNFMENIDVSEIIFKVLSSQKLAEFVDGRILQASEKDVINRQKLVIEELNKEIELVKTKLAENLNVHQNLQHSIDALKSSQSNILAEIEDRDKAMSARFGGLLAEIDAKMAKLNDEQFTQINKQVKLYLLEILGYKNGHDINEIDLKNWVRNTFVAKEFLEEKLLELYSKVNIDIKAEIDHSGVLLMKEIGDKLKIEILKSVELKQSEINSQNKNVKVDISVADVKKIVKDVLAVYDADKTGLVDYALESAGGQVLSTRCTENYQYKSAQISVFGIPLWYPSNTPRIAISPAVQPGECWAFQGFPGFLVIKLNSMVFVNGFTLEHIPKSLAPNRKIDSAPKNFSVWGLTNEDDQDPILFGEYEYFENSTALQYFPVQNKEIRRPFEVVELRIESNHGNLAYTCLYRFRVHGLPST